MAQTPGFSLESWNQVARNAFAQGMTWERITVLLYVFGELAMRVGPELLILVPVSLVQSHDCFKMPLLNVVPEGCLVFLCQMNHWSVRDFLRWMMSFSHSNPLTWAPGRQVCWSVVFPSLVTARPCMTLYQEHS